MGSNHRRIEIHHSRLDLQGVENQLPTALGGPAIAEPPGGVPVSDGIRQVEPGSTGAGNPENDIAKQSVRAGDPARWARAIGTETLEAVPVSVGHTCWCRTSGLPGRIGMTENKP